MRFKTKCEKMIITMVLVANGMIMMGGNVSKAALQANSTTHASPKKDSGSNWFWKIRCMETIGETMGLGVDLNNGYENDLTEKISNNIDIHMMRTTEYGAMAILSASGFGNPKQLSEVDIKTTTGNVTGVYLTTGDRSEWTAGVSDVNSVKGYSARYYDLYNLSNTSAKVGDALGTDSTPNVGCAGWHGATGSTEKTWLGGGLNYGFKRGSYNKIFSFNGESSYNNRGNWNLDTDTYSPSPSRGVAVVKSGV